MNVQGAAQTLNYKTPPLFSGAACGKPETIRTLKLPPIPEVVWKQPLEIFIDQYNLNYIINDSSIQYTHETSETTLASQTSHTKRIQPQNYVIPMEQPPANQAGNELVPFLNWSKNCLTDNQEPKMHTTTTLTGDATVPLLKITTPLIEEELMRDKHTKELYLYQ